MFPKKSSHKRRPKKYENKKHLNWIHSFECSLSNLECNDSIQAHHLLRPWRGFRGVGIKAGDENLIPLCEFHHRKLHEHGDEENYFKLKTGSETFGREEAQRFWLKSPFYERLDEK